MGDLDTYRLLTIAMLGGFFGAVYFYGRWRATKDVQAIALAIALALICVGGLLAKAPLLESLQERGVIDRMRPNTPPE